MATFPTIEILTGLSVKNIKPANRKTSAAGYSMSRARATVTKKEFTLKYECVSAADKTTVDDFFDANQGQVFNLNAPDPADSTIYTVIFGQDSIDWTYSNQGAGSWSTLIIFQEV